MKKFILLLVLVLGLTGCSSSGSDDSAKEEKDEKISIVCTIFPTYDWINNILGEENERFSVTLLGKGTDLHSYQPSADDIAKIKKSDLLVYVGGDVDDWVNDVEIPETTRTLKLFDVLRSQLRATRDADDARRKRATEAEIYDDHVWLSLDMAKDVVSALTREICLFGETGSATFRENAKNYEYDLVMLDHEYEKAVAESMNKTVIFADRFPFYYLMQDYNIDCYSAFSGCSADADASVEGVAWLAKRTGEFKKETVLALEHSQNDIAQTVIENSGINGKVVVMQSCQFITDEDIASGITYLGIMEENLASLREALK